MSNCIMIRHKLTPVFFLMLMVGCAKNTESFSSVLIFNGEEKDCLYPFVTGLYLDGELDNASKKFVSGKSIMLKPGPMKVFASCSIPPAEKNEECLHEISFEHESLKIVPTPNTTYHLTCNPQRELVLEKSS